MPGDLDAVNEEGGSSSSWFLALFCIVGFSAEPDLMARTGGFMFRTGGFNDAERDKPGGCGWMNGSETEWERLDFGTDSKGDVGPLPL